MSANDGGLYLVMPNRNGAFHLRYSVPSLLAGIDASTKLVVVDDGSADDSLAILATFGDRVAVVPNHRSRGFAGGVNTGIELALSQGASYVAIINSDIQIGPEWLAATTEVLATLAPHEGLGVLGFVERLRRGDDLTVDWRDPEFSTRTVPVPADRLPGCCFLCPTRALRQVGLFDEGYFMYGEDNDFFFRMKKAGLALVQSGVPVWHYGEGASRSGRAAFRISWLAYRNAIRFGIKNETLRRNLRILASLLYWGCLPFVTIDQSDPSARRIRRYSPFVNLTLLTGALLWNGLHLFATLNRRFFPERIP